MSLHPMPPADLAALEAELRHQATYRPTALVSIQQVQQLIEEVKRWRKGQEATKDDHEPTHHQPS